jgi:peptide/nickel transport system substrate-binding protein
MEEMMEEPAVNPGKVIWMTGGWGNERFDPALAPGGDPNQYGRLITGYLIEISDDFELIPGMATDWALSSDGLTWTVTLRDGVKFHDGTEVTADDVLWTWQHFYSHESREYTTSGAMWALENILDKMEKTGANKIKITTTTPHTGIADYYFSRRSPVWYGALPKRDTIDGLADAVAYDKNPIGTGSLKLVGHVPAEVMEFERFQDYYYQPSNGLPEDRRPKFANFDLRSVPEEAIRVAAIRAGEADIAPVTLQAKGQVEAGGGRLVFGREGVYFHFVCELCWKDPEFLLYDKRVRQALAYSIDKELMRDTLYGAEAMEVKGWGFVTPATIGYTPAVDPFPFDPGKARELMAEAGYKTATNPEGKEPGTLIINTLTSPSLPLLPEASQLIAENWKRELGIDVEVRVGEKVGLEGAEDAGELAGQWYFRDNETRVDATGITKGVYGNPSRISRYQDDPKVYAQIDEALAIADPEKQVVTLEKLYQQLRDEQYNLAIGYLNIPWAVGPRVVSWESKPLSLFPNNLHNLILE